MWCRQKEAERRREDGLKREREAQKRQQRKQAYSQVPSKTLIPVTSQAHAD